MKRDMELIRTILLKLEEDNEPNKFKILTVDGYDITLVSYHVKLLVQAGFVEGKDTNINQYFRWYAKSLTYEGHEFLDSVRNDGVWNKLKTKLSSEASTLPLAIISGVALELTKQFAKELFGLNGASQ